MLTFADAKADRGIKVATAVSTSSQDFTDYVNAAARKAKRRGDWPGTVLPIHVCARKGCIVWPRYVSAVRKINVCKEPVEIHNDWYSFLGRESWNRYGAMCGGECTMIGQTQAPAYSDVYGDGRYIRAYPQLSQDFGKTITIFGIDNYNQPLRHRDVNGDWVDGVVLTLQLPYAQTDMFVRKIDRVIKDQTQGNVTLYGYNTTDLVLEGLAVYEPTETSPSYARYKLNAPSCQVSTSCNSANAVVALVKLEFIPVQVNTDALYIQNLDALKLMIQAIKYEEAGDRANARQYEADAIRELNLDLYDLMGDDQITVSISPFGDVPMDAIPRVF